MSVTATVLSVGRSRRESFDKSAPTPLVAVVVHIPVTDAERMAASFDPDSRFSPNAEDSRCLARPIVEALAAQGLGQSERDPGLLP